MLGLRLCNVAGLWAATLGLLCTSPTLHAQNRQEEWPLGNVILIDGDTLAGQIFINLDQEMVEVQTTSTLKAYTARQVLLVRQYEPARLYAAHEATLRGTMAAPALFEVLLPGAFATLMVRERVGHNNAPLYDQYGQRVGTFYGQKQFLFDFYVLDHKGRVRRLPTKRKELVKFLDAAQPGQLVDYVRRHKPDPASKEDMIGWLSFFNHFKTEQPPSPQ